MLHGFVVLCLNEGHQISDTLSIVGPNQLKVPLYSLASVQ